MTTLPNIPELQTYPLKEILSAHKHICEFFKRSDFEIPDIPFQKTFLSAIVSANKSNGDKFKEKQIPWEELLIREVSWAERNRKTPEEAWDYISNKVSTWEVIKQFPEWEPKRIIDEGPQKSDRQDELRREIKPRPIVKPSLKKNARGLKWRAANCWDWLTPCAKAVFMVLCARAHWPKKLESFPWAFGGVGTRTKEEGEKPGSLCRLTSYGRRQVTNSLRQLQGLGMIKKINRGYEGHGVSKFYVFFTPEMSRAFTAIAKNKKRIPSKRKQTSRMS